MGVFFMKPDSFDTFSPYQKEDRFKALINKQWLKRLADPDSSYTSELDSGGEILPIRPATSSPVDLAKVFRFFIGVRRPIKKWSIVFTAESGTESPTNIEDIYYKISDKPGIEENDFDLDARLVSPPMAQRRIKIKLRNVGKLSPLISFDPELD